MASQASEQGRQADAPFSSQKSTDAILTHSSLAVAKVQKKIQSKFINLN